MILVYNLLIILISIQWSGATEYETHILKQLTRICPYTAYCRNTSEVPEPSYDIGPEKESCCIDCSCENDCVHNCCFWTEKQRADVDFQREKCMYLISKPPPKTKADLYFTYYIVTAPPQTGCVHSSIITNVSFVSQDKASFENQDIEIHSEWDKFYPMYSKILKKIFYNRSLALCYGDEQPTPFEYVVYCETGERAWTADRISTYISEMDNPDRYCLNEFYYNGNLNDIAHRRCFPNLVKTCPDIQYEIGDRLDMNHEQIEDVCKSGLYAPYWFGGNFANPFCAMCNGLKHKDFCPIYQPPKVGPFSSLLAINKGISETNGQPAVRMKEKVACKYQGASLASCRPVLCPAGFVRAINGTCVWPITNFLIPIQLSFNLKPNETITIDEIRIITGLYNTSVNINFDWLVFPFPYMITNIVAIFKKDSYVLIDCLSVKFYINESKELQKGIPYLLDTISDSLNKVWIANLKDRVIEFNPSIGSSYWDLTITKDKTGTKKERRHIETLQKVGSNSYMRITNSFLDKMFMCEQVELNGDEFTPPEEIGLEEYHIEYIGRRSIAYYGDTKGQVLFSYEFTLNELTGSVRICLEDAQMTLYDKNNAFSQQYGRIHYTFVDLFILILLHLL